MAKQYCMNCGSIVDDSTGYCPVCGEPLGQKVEKKEETTQTTINVAFPKDPEIESTQQIPVEVQQQTLPHIPSQNVQVDDEEEDEKPVNPVKKFLSRIVFEPDEEEYDEPKKTRSHSDDEESSFPVLPVVLVVIVSILIGSIGYLWIARPDVLNSGLKTIGLGLPGYQEEVKPEPTTTAEPTASAEATVEPEVTAEPSLGTVTVAIESINIRSLPSTSGDALGKAKNGTSYEILDKESAEGYTWYKIGEDQWIADKDGTWVTISQ